MRNLSGIGVSAIAVSAALGLWQAAAAGPIGAPRVLTTNVADYNAAQVTTADGVLTVLPGVATYAVNAGSLEVNSRFTVTLPTGFTFGSQPSLSDNGISTFSIIAGGIGAQTATFSVGVAPLVAGQSATLGSFSVQGATALGTPIPVAGALPLSVQATNNAEIQNNDPVPLTKGTFASEPGVQAAFVGAIQFVDLAPPSNGALFLSSPDTPTAVIAATAISAEPVDPVAGVQILSPSGAPNSLSSSDTATVTLAGFFNGIKSVFVSIPNSDCSTPVATGTVTPTQAIFTDVPINREAFLCVTSTGVNLLQENIKGFSANVSPGTSIDFLGAPATVEFPGIITYTGGGVISVTNFFTGDDSGYSSLLRVNNAGSGAVTLFALVQPDTGGPALTGPLGSLGAGVGTVFTEPQVATAVTGLTLPTSGQRATVQFIIGGDFGAVAASSFLVNPSGVVTNVGVQPNSSAK